jgi:signal transduction histidine kinase
VTDAIAAARLTPRTRVAALKRIDATGASPTPTSAKPINATHEFAEINTTVIATVATLVDAGHDVTLVGQTRASIPAIPGALQRCLTNLIDNTVKYGGYARVTVACEAGDVVIRVAVGGPGIPEAQMERVFDPFYRLETSRSRETGGSGLGLTIARNIAHKHGGTLTLRNKPGGGLECLLVLPIQR